MNNIAKHAQQINTLGSTLIALDKYYRRVRINQIHTMKEAGYNQNQIATALGMPASNVARDLKKWPNKLDINPDEFQHIGSIVQAIINPQEDNND